MYTKNPASGVTNIKLSGKGKFRVQVQDKYLGTFPTLEKAIQIRDEYRAKATWTKERKYASHHTINRF